MTVLTARAPPLKPPRIALLCAAALLLLLLLAAPPATPAPLLRGAPPACVELGPTFWSLGVAVMTDKVTQDPALMFWGTSHNYQYAYEKYLRKLRCMEEGTVQLLEIGLGCGMSYPEGHSIPLWLALLPRVTINVFEYDAPCARA